MTDAEEKIRSFLQQNKKNDLLVIEKYTFSRGIHPFKVASTEVIEALKKMNDDGEINYRPKDDENFILIRDLH